MEFLLKLAGWAVALHFFWMGAFAVGVYLVRKRRQRRLTEVSAEGNVTPGPSKQKRTPESAISMREGEVDQSA